MINLSSVLKGTLNFTYTRTSVVKILGYGKELYWYRIYHQEPKSINHRSTRHPAFVNHFVMKLYNSVFLPPDPVSVFLRIPDPTHIFLQYSIR